jgi:hypothetical protein
MNKRARFTVVFEPAAGVDGIRSLRWLLKRARRQYGLIAVSAHEETAPTNIADALGQLRRDVNRRMRGGHD